MKHVNLRSYFDAPGSLPRATTLLQEGGIRVVLFHVKAGETLPEHHAAGAITVLCLTGQCTLIAGTETLEMSPNALASLAPRVSHSVVAQQETLLLVSIGDPAAAELQPR